MGTSARFRRQSILVARGERALVDGRPYRGKYEMVRDFWFTALPEARMRRIMHGADLDPLSFQADLAHPLEGQLVTSLNGLARLCLE
jgi:hypothetical protein